jgi:hypothetical protein
MASKTIPQKLKLKPPRLKYIEQCGKELHNEEEIIALCQSIMDKLDVEYGIQETERTRHCNDNGSRGSFQNQT